MFHAPGNDENSQAGSQDPTEVPENGAQESPEARKARFKAEMAGKPTSGIEAYYKRLYARYPTLKGGSPELHRLMGRVEEDLARGRRRGGYRLWNQADDIEPEIWIEALMNLVEFHGSWTAVARKLKTSRNSVIMWKSLRRTPSRKMFDRIIRADVKAAELAQRRAKQQQQGQRPGEEK